MQSCLSAINKNCIQTIKVSHSHVHFPRSLTLDVIFIKLWINPQIVINGIAVLNLCKVFLYSAEHISGTNVILYSEKGSLRFHQTSNQLVQTSCFNEVRTNVPFLSVYASKVNPGMKSVSYTKENILCIQNKISAQ